MLVSLKLACILLRWFALPASLQGGETLKVIGALLFKCYVINFVFVVLWFPALPYVPL